MKEFYDNLELMDENKFKSRIGEKKIILCRKDLIDCFGMKDKKDDHFLISSKKIELFKEINDGIGDYPEKDVFNTNFDLLIRLFHKVVMDCLLWCTAGEKMKQS